jgi:uncharacterized protein (TIGR02246 family)
VRVYGVTSALHELDHRPKRSDHGARITPKDNHLRKLIRAACILTFSLTAAPAIADPAVDAFEAAQQAAWNAHDAAAYAAAFDPEADVITALGWRWTGQAEAARNLGDGFKIVYAKAQLSLSGAQVRTLTPDMAFVTLNWSITGARTIDGASDAGEQHGFETQLLERRGTGWIIHSQQDTASAAPLPTSLAFPERTAAPTAAFPTTPPPVRRCVIARKTGECVLYGKAKPAPAN